MTNHWSEDIARPEDGTTDRPRVTASDPLTSPLPPGQRPAVEIDEWRQTIEDILGGRYAGSSPSRPRRGRAKAPHAIVRGHVCGHQCTAISPRLIAIWGGQQAACRRLCRVQLDPREDEDDNAHRSVASWFGRESYLDGASTTYDRQYRTVRPIMVKKRAGTTGGGVAKRAFMQVVRVMADAADHETGRNCRLTNATIAVRSGLSETTVTRVRLAMLLMGLATEVIRGRQRTRAERMASWRVGDKARGWASVWALHPARVSGSVDNQVDNSGRIRAGQNKMATHPLWGHCTAVKETSSSSYETAGCGKRGASRRSDKKRVARKTAPPPQKALILALKWLGDERTPVWARRNRADAWARVLAVAAEHGWTPDDLNDSIRPAAEVRYPLAYVRAMLESVDLPFPPHVVREIEERRAAEDQAAAARMIDDIVTEVKQAEQERRAAVRETALTGEGRKAAKAVVDAAEQRRKDGTPYDHRAHWRRLAQGAHTRPPREC